MLNASQIRLRLLNPSILNPSLRTRRRPASGLGEMRRFGMLVRQRGAQRAHLGEVQVCNAMACASDFDSIPAAVYARASAMNTAPDHGLNTGSTH
jgi:hypothetical protein